MDSTCAAEDCERPRRRREWCSTHYDRVRIHGEPNPPGLRAWGRQPATCSIEGCLEPARKRTWCKTHYQRWRDHGDPNPQGVRRWVRQGPICSVDGCEKPTDTRGWCTMHLERWRKHGDVGAAEPLRYPGKTCDIEGCDEPHSGLGWCERHYKRWTVHSDPLGYTRPGNYAGDDVGYIGVHHRLRDERGKAAEYLCDHCGANAAHWAYGHTDPNPKTSHRGSPYSVDLSHYIPLCASCHCRLDRAMGPYI